MTAPAAALESLAPTEEKPWHASFPAIKKPADFLPRSEVLSLLKQDEESVKSVGGKRKVFLVDLRRNDHDGETIHPSINLPAQSLYTSLPTLIPLLHTAGVTHIIYYCGSSQGRGSRAAGWTRDWIEENQDKVEGIRGFALEGGIKGWRKAAGEGGEEKDWLRRTDGV